VRAAVLAASRVRRAGVKASCCVASLPCNEASGMRADVGGGGRVFRCGALRGGCGHPCAHATHVRRVAVRGSRPWEPCSAKIVVLCPWRRRREDEVRGEVPQQRH